MPLQFDEDGLQISTKNEIKDNLISDYTEILGSQKVASNAPLGQVIDIQSQANIDIQEVLLQIYNSVDLDKAEGVSLDKLFSITSFQRRGGTYTIQDIVITVDRIVTLAGLDDDLNEVDGEGYTVTDDDGNQFILTQTAEDLAIGNHTLTFRAKETGVIKTTINSITNPVTVVLGVTNINNLTVQSSIGEDVETDAQARIRRDRAIYINAKNSADAIYSNILSLDGILHEGDVQVFENRTDSIDSRGMIPHSIWAVVEGGTESEIGEAIFSDIAGASMNGAIIVPVLRLSGDYFNAKFDRPLQKDLYVKFNIQPTIIGQSFDEENIKNYILSNISFRIGDFVETSTIVEVAKKAINSTGGGGAPVALKISKDGIIYEDYLVVDTVDEKYILDSSRIDITVL